MKTVNGVFRKLENVFSGKTHVLFIKKDSGELVSFLVGSTIVPDGVSLTNETNCLNMETSEIEIKETARVIARKSSDRTFSRNGQIKTFLAANNLPITFTAGHIGSFDTHIS